MATAKTTKQGKKYVILRGVINDGQTKTPLPKSITKDNLRQVWTLLNEKMFEEFGLIHFRSGFLEDKMHDWDVTKKNELRFYGHSGAKGDVHDLVLIYE